MKEFESNIPQFLEQVQKELSEELTKKGEQEELATKVIKKMGERIIHKLIKDMKDAIKEYVSKTGNEEMSEKLGPKPEEILKILDEEVKKDFFLMLGIFVVGDMKYGATNFYEFLIYRYLDSVENANLLGENDYTKIMKQVVKHEMTEKNGFYKTDVESLKSKETFNL